MAVATRPAPAAAEDKELLISGSEAVAEALTLADIDVVTAYPIRPYDTVMQAIAKKIANGQLVAEYIVAEGEHSQFEIVKHASTVGARVFDPLPGAHDGAAEVEGGPVPAALRPGRPAAPPRQPDHRGPAGQRGLGHRDPASEQRGDGARVDGHRGGVRGVSPGLRPRAGEPLVRGVHDRRRRGDPGGDGDHLPADQGGDS